MARYFLGGRSWGSLSDAGTSALLPFSNVTKMVKNADAPEGIRGLWVGTAGTANFVTLDGDTVTNFPLQVGYNPIVISKLNSGGTADDIWGAF